MPGVWRGSWMGPTGFSYRTAGEPALTEPTHPQTPPTHPGPIPTPDPIRRPWAGHAIIALSPPVIAWLAPVLIESPVPVLLFLFMLPPFGLVFLIEVLRPKQSLLRHAALVIAPGVLMTWMVLIIMASTSSTGGNRLHLCADLQLVGGRRCLWDRVCSGVRHETATIPQARPLHQMRPRPARQFRGSVPGVRCGRLELSR